jgi:multidrug efflux pump subunit AcrA (membrane-fusion protein)
MAACDFCTGTHYLSDTPALGPCVCCTPENMQKRDRTIAALCDDPELPRLRARVAELEATQRQTEKADDAKSAVELLDAAEAAIGRARDMVASAEREREKARAERYEWRRGLAEKLADYFVSIGLPAVPVTVDNAHLAELYAQIEPVADVEPEE